MDGYYRIKHNKQIRIPDDIKLIIEEHLKELIVYYHPNADDYPESYKICLLGAGAVGLSAIAIRFVANTYRQEYDPTIEDHYCKTIIVDNYPAFIEIIDTAGQEQFAALQWHWIRENDGFIICYAVNSERSFTHCKDLWGKY